MKPSLYLQTAAWAAHLPLLMVLPRLKRRAADNYALAAAAVLEAAVVGEGTPGAATGCGPLALSAALSQPLLADGEPTNDS